MEWSGMEEWKEWKEQWNEEGGMEEGIGMEWKIKEEWKEWKEWNGMMDEWNQK